SPPFPTRRSSDLAGTVTGVRFRHQGSPATGASATTNTLRADLVIDATGRGSRAPRWLSDLGFASPSEDAVNVDLRYATRLFRRRTGAGQAPRNGVVAPLPGKPRGAVAAAVAGH